MLYASLFLNGCLFYQMEGATIRRAGRFVGIDRETYTDNTLDYKLCGQWFVTAVKHNFFRNVYVNQITAVKNYAHTSLKLKTDVD
jgi:Na+-transporting NADH:ubiquinone oxidoreductase subunit NqrF